MDPARWDRVKTVYHLAAERDSRERAAFVEQACRGDPELQREVESLLAQDSGGSFLEHPAWQDTAREVAQEFPPAPHPFRWVVGLTVGVLAALFAYAADRKSVV